MFWKAWARGHAQGNVVTSRRRMPHGTPRIQLRQVEFSDIAEVVRWANDPRIVRMTARKPVPMQPESVKDMITDALAQGSTNDLWVLDGAQAGLPTFVGLVSLTRLSPEKSEIGYWIIPPYWNLGLAGQAVQLLLSRNPHRAGVVMACVSRDNLASIRVLQRAGFSCSGESEEYFQARGRYVPTRTFRKVLRLEENGAGLKGMGPTYAKHAESGFGKYG